MDAQILIMGVGSTVLRSADNKWPTAVAVVHRCAPLDDHDRHHVDHRAELAADSQQSRSATSATSQGNHPPRFRR